MRNLLLTGTALLFAASTTAQAADNYMPAPRYGAAPPPPAAYGPGPPVQAVPGLAEAPPPPYAQLPPPLAYPLPPQPFYPPTGYGPDPGWVYGGPPVATFNCWWDASGNRVCARPLLVAAGLSPARGLKKRRSCRELFQADRAGKPDVGAVWRLTQTLGALPPEVLEPLG